MSLMDDQPAWLEFGKQYRLALLGQRDPVTYQNHGLGLVAVDGTVHGQNHCDDSFQTPTRGPWLADILDAPLGAPVDVSVDVSSASDSLNPTRQPSSDATIAAALRHRGIELRCEPGRSLLDGCGMTIARVEFRKRAANGDWFIGLSMNGTQCRTTSVDFLIDPILVPFQRHGVADRGPAMAGYLVGAYCTESELLSLRKLRFPWGVQRGDLIVFPNTAGYWMHFMESRSHQFPLAKNLVMADSHARQWRLDAVDGGAW